MSLTPHQQDLILATVPLLREGGEALTRHFYALMFNDYPQVKSLFNQTHQQDGRQPRALAGAVLAYAENIRNPMVLAAAIEGIVNKHASLNILPEHYPIVGNSLLKAMGEVLGDVLTPEIADAWGAAYWQLANLLIAEEEKVYADHAARPGGWRGERRFVVREKTPESSVITSFVLTPEDGGPVMDFLPGQYLGVSLDIDGERVRRNYSLSAAPNGRDYRISVKREAGGQVSGFLHDRLQPGDVINLSAPCGEFTLGQGDQPVNLITAGVGITPAMAMLEAYAGQRPIRFIHAAISRDHHAFRERVDALAGDHEDVSAHYLYEEGLPGEGAHGEGRISRQWLDQWLAPEGDCYFLGPLGFMQAVKRQLTELGVPAERQRFEFFGPSEALA
ncbi:MAG: NO-inducible flavohemoprotein [Alcanivorax sp.]|nr:NO-inducible flavohemoprotein [Alcanivorax sp.]